MDKNTVVIITGMSGAGKSTTLDMFEDADFVCVQNLPIALIDKFVALIPRESKEKPQKFACSVDVRSRNERAEFQLALTELTRRGVPYKLLFLDATSDVLLKRYKETRRSHPLSGRDRIEAGIEKERRLLRVFRETSDYIIDTSQLLVRELKEELTNIFLRDASYCNLFITVLSFGFKSGIPKDADLVFDVRFLPNPYYVDTLKHHTGREEAVRSYVMECEPARTFLAKLDDLIGFLIPNYVKEGKNQLVIAIGCTGGKHRSVAVADALFAHLRKNDSYGVRIEHRDIEKE